MPYQTTTTTTAPRPAYQQRGPVAGRPATNAAAYQAAPAQRPQSQPEGTVNIRGKQYVLVAQRVKMAIAAGGYTMLANDLVQMGPGDRWFVRITIKIGDNQFSGTAEVKWNGKPGTPDGDAPVENAETSALGRALAFAGFIADGGIASADEMSRVKNVTVNAEDQ